MTAGAPWSVKGIDPKAREIAKDLARRSGMTLGEWLNQVILEDESAGEAPPPAPRYPSFGRHVAPEPRRFEGYSRSVEDAFRSTEALDRLSARIEAAEHRAAGAIGGIEQAVANLVARLDGAERESEAVGARIEGLLDGMRAEQARASERLRKIEQDASDSRTSDVLKALEAALAKMVGQVSADRDQAAETFDGLRQELDGVHERLGEAFTEDGARGLVESVIARLSGRLEQAELRTGEALRGLEAAFAGLDGRMKSTEAEVADRSREMRLEALASDFTDQIVAIRAEMAENIRASANDGRFAQIDQALAAMGEHVRAAEKRSAGAIEKMGQDVLRIADTMARAVQDVEARNSEAIEKTEARTAEAIEQAETRSGQAIEKASVQFGAEVAQLSGRFAKAIDDVEKRSHEAVERVGGEITRVLDQRLGQVDAASAQALERLSGEIAKISDRLTERIANAERRSAQAIDDVGEQVARVTDRLQERYERASVDLTERIRLSEERTARLLEDARDRIDQRLAEAQRRAAESAPPAASEAPDYDAYAYADPAVAPFGDGALEVEAAERTPTQSLIDHITRDLGHASEEPPDETELFRASEPTVEFEEPFEAEDELIEPASEPGAAEDFGSGLFAASTEEPEVDADNEWLSSIATHEAAAEADYALEADEHHALIEPPAHFEDEDAGEDPSVHLAALAAHSEAPHEDADADVGFDAADDLISAEPMRPRTTRELVEQARAAARASSSGADGKSKGRGKPKADRSGGSLFGGFGLGGKKNQGGSAMRAALVVSGSAAALSVAVASYVILADKPHGALPDRVAQALGVQSGSASQPAANEVAPNPFAAVALSPKPIAGQVAVDQQAQLPPVAGPGGAELYNDAVQRIEAQDKTGVPILEKAANLGYAPAQFYLGKLYEDGQAGLPKDLVEARRWTERAAEGGDRKAMHNLALYFFEGAGGPKNLSSAADWFRRAASLGLVDSQYNLARLYEEGLGVPQNPAEAYKWYLIAARSGDAESRMSALRIKSQLSPEAQSAAERAADGFEIQTADAGAPASPDPATAPAAVAGNDIATAQRALSKLGFYQGPADGAASPALKLAIAAYQRGQGLPATGALDLSLDQRLAAVLQQ